jgi:quercetin dioxygenase-like cupin family protein
MAVEQQLHRWASEPATEVAPGITRRYFNTDRLTMARFLIAAGAVVPVHKHEQEQISSVLRGALKFTVGGDEVVVRTGEALTIPSWVEHGVVCLEETDVVDVFSSIRQDWLDGSANYFKKS